MFALKITIEEEMLEHVRDAKTPRKLGRLLLHFF